MTTTELISFARGAPSLDIIDVDGLKAAAMRAFDIDPAAVTGYGPAAGYRPLRQWIADRYAVGVDHVLITNGSLQAAAFLFEQLVSPGDDVIVEKPTYDRTLLTLRNLGAKIHQIPLDKDGIDVTALRVLLESGVRPTLAHVIPNFQNPSGVTTSLERRQALVAMASEFGFTIFEDDPYHEIRFRGAALPSMLNLAGPAEDVAGTADGATRTTATVVHASSFTKTVCPGVRVGYLVGPTAVLNELARRAAKTYISPGMLAEVTVHQFCASATIDSSIARVRLALAERAARLAEALRREIPGCSFHEPDGGYFLWVDLPGDVDVAALAPAAAARGVAVVEGTGFLLEGGRHSLRLAYSAVTAERVDEGVRRLAQAIADVRDAV